MVYRSLELNCKALADLQQAEEYWSDPKNKVSYQAQQQLRQRREEIVAGVRDSALIVLRDFIIAQP